MPGPAEIKAIVHSYIEMMCNSDVDSIMSLYDRAATAQDPVGGETLQGHDALRHFYTVTAPMLQVELVGPICVAGDACAFPLLAQLTVGTEVSYLDATDIFSFNEAGKITRMQAYWNPGEMRSRR